MKNYYKIQKVVRKKAEKLINTLVFCNYCNEPFKECDTVVPCVGVIIGEIDIVKHQNKFWHSGCIADFKKFDNLRSSL